MDLHLEVSHGPHVIDNNCFLSDLNLWNMAVDLGEAIVPGVIFDNPDGTPNHI